MAGSCACDYTATALGCNALKLPEQGNVLMPYIIVTFRGSGRTITVGNESCPDIQNHACIRDFEFGLANGTECRVTIHDEQGGSFVQFMQDILRDINCAVGKNGTNMVVRYGWVARTCPDQVLVPPPSQPFYLMMRDIECNFSGGKFMFTITGVDLTEIAFEARDKRIHANMHLRDAIVRLFTSGCPPIVSSVKFLKPPRDCTSEPTELEFKNYTDDNDQKQTCPPSNSGNSCNPNAKRGLKADWNCNGNTKMAAARAWLQQQRTRDDKGFRVVYNPEADGGEVIIWEDPKPNSGETYQWDQMSLGTFIVNGGPKSRVLEFNPKIKWNFSVLTNAGGGAGGGRPLINNKGGQNQGLPTAPSTQTPKQCTVGVVTSSAADQPNIDNQGAREADGQVDGSQAVNNKAETLFFQPIEGDLVIMGDPTLSRPSLCLFRPVHIVFLNPYYIYENAFNCGDWLAQPQCNVVLSNKAWLIKNITHRISNGKFTTTLGVFLTPPAVDIDVDKAWGGPGSCGWTPPGCT